MNIIFFPTDCVTASRVNMFKNKIDTGLKFKFKLIYYYYYYYYLTLYNIYKSNQGKPYMIK